VTGGVLSCYFGLLYAILVLRVCIVAPPGRTYKPTERRSRDDKPMAFIVDLPAVWIIRIFCRDIDVCGETRRERSLTEQIL